MNFVGTEPMPARSDMNDWLVDFTTTNPESTNQTQDDPFSANQNIAMSEGPDRNKMDMDPA